MTCNNNTPTMSLSVGTVDSGALPKVEITNYGTPQNTDWVMDMTVPATDPATLEEAKAYTDQRIDGLPLSAKRQLYAHYIFVHNSASAAARLILRGQIYFINSDKTPVTDHATLAAMISSRACISGLWRQSNDVNPDGKQQTFLACRVHRYTRDSDVMIGGMCIDLDSLGWREFSLNTADIAFTDIVISVGTNAG